MHARMNLYSIGKMVPSLLVVSAVFLGGCLARTVSGSGDLSIEERSVSGFDSLSLEGAGRVLITQGGSESLSIETDDNLLRYIESEVDDGRLHLRWSRGTLLRPTEGITYRIQMRELRLIDASGAGSFEIGSLETDSLVVRFSGAGRLVIDDLQVEDLDLELSGAGALELAGNAEQVAVSISGLGSYNAAELQTSQSAIEISGGGSAELWAEDALSIELSGLGEVRYYGDPEVTQDISGGGRVVSLGEK